MRNFEVSARSRHFKNILMLIVLLIIAAGITFSVERSQLRDGIRVDGRIVDIHRKASGGGPTRDAYEIVIEYPVDGQPRRFTTSRVVWDSWGTFNTVGATVPVLYLKNGEAFINRFAYLYPFSTMLLGVLAAATGALVWLLVIPRSRIEAVALRRKRYKHIKTGARWRLAPNRRQLLRRLDLWLLMNTGLMVLVAIGVLQSFVWLVILSFAAAVLIHFLMRRILVCPHCGASLMKDLREIEPRLVSKTNWLTVRGLLAKGAPLTCRNCAHSLDD